MSSARRLALVTVSALSVAAWGIAEEVIPAVFTPTSKNAAAIVENSNEAPPDLTADAPSDLRGSDGLNLVPTQMEAVRVHDSRLEARRLESLGKLLRIHPAPPSLEGGGLLLRKKVGNVEAEIGPQPWTELFSEEAKFSTKPGMPRIEFVHLRF